MNINDSSQAFFSACGNYDPQLWAAGWRQEPCYPPYYAPTDPSNFPCASSAQFMNHQKFEFPGFIHPPPHHPSFNFPQPIPASRTSSLSCSTPVEPSSSSTPTTSNNQSSDQPQAPSSSSLSYNIIDSSSNHPTSSTKLGSEANAQPDSAKDGYSTKVDDSLNEASHVKQEATSSDCSSSKKKRDRFNGLTEEDVLKRTVPDLLSHNLDIIIIGSCPGLTAAYLGHHYAGPGNHFWKCLYLSGLIPEPMNASDDYKLKQYGIGFTNFVARCTKGSVEFSRREIKEGIESLTEKIQMYKPKIAVFNGKGIYEVFCNHKNFYIGKQPETFPGTNTVVYVMPSSSARCSQLPRASDKVPFFVALRKLRDHLMGCLPHLEEGEVVFPDLDLKVEPRKDRRSSDECVQQPRPGSRNNSSEDRKRRMLECSTGFPDVMAAQRMMYRSFVPPQDYARWSAGCFPGWPTHPSLPLPPHQYVNYDAAAFAMANVPSGAGLFRNIPSSPFYSGWSGDPQYSHHRWAAAAMHHHHHTHPHPHAVTADSRYNIHPYFQPLASPVEMLSAAAFVGAQQQQQQQQQQQHHQQQLQQSQYPLNGNKIPSLPLNMPDFIDPTRGPPTYYDNMFFPPDNYNNNSGSGGSSNSNTDINLIRQLSASKIISSSSSLISSTSSNNVISNMTDNNSNNKSSGNSVSNSNNNNNNNNNNNENTSNNNNNNTRHSSNNNNNNNNNGHHNTNYDDVNDSKYS